MNPFTTHGAISWPELLTTDVAKATTFYTTVFGWDTEEMPMEDGTYIVVKAGGGNTGGIVALPGQNIPPHWALYVTVEDVEAVAERVPQLGGQVLHPVSQAGNVGRFCVVQDPTGGVISAITYNPPSDEQMHDMPEPDFAAFFGTHGAFSWFELRTPDTEKAMPFYTSLFGWEIKVGDMPTGPYPTITVDGAMIGGFVSPPAVDNVPPHWGAYVTVDDVDAIAQAVTDNGGSVVVAPFDIERVGRIAIFADQDGAMLSAISYPQEPEAATD